jgi:hypothetical protein
MKSNSINQAFRSGWNDRTKHVTTGHSQWIASGDVTSVNLIVGMLHEM